MYPVHGNISGVLVTIKILYLNLIYGHTDVFIKVVESVLTADKFQLPSPAATTTKEIAVAAIQWSKKTKCSYKSSIQ